MDECNSGCDGKGECAAAMRSFAKLLWTIVTASNSGIVHGALGAPVLGKTFLRFQVYRVSIASCCLLAACTRWTDEYAQIVFSRADENAAASRCDAKIRSFRGADPISAA